jgi:Xaa-Pro aminopeptidase
MEALDEAIREKGAAAYVAIGSSADADIRYLTRFRISDPVIYWKKPGEQGTIIVSAMEYERANRESIVRVTNRNEAGFFEYLKEDPENRRRATARMIAELIKGDVVVPPHFPLALARELEAFCRVEVEEGAVAEMRAIKAPWERDQIRYVQQVTEKAMNAALQACAASRVENEILTLEGSSLTSEKVKSIIHRCLIEHGCLAHDTIVSCGVDTALPHLTGSGPLRPDEPIIIDIFPQHEESGYYADMTRTVVKGEPSPEILEMYKAVHEAQETAARLLRAGEEGAGIHQAIVDFFQERGYASNQEGFIHNLGHGVGLEVHEPPVLGPGGKRLEEGHIVTIEPGLYYRDRGGVRLEDMGLILKGGFERFTRFKERLIL